MDLSCIILSGDLELYVLGMLPQEEAYQIEQLSKLFPEVKEELDRISASLEEFAQATAVEPSPAVKESLMQKIKGLSSEEQSVPVIPLSSTTEEKKETPVIALQKNTRSSFLIAASTIGFIICAGLAMYLFSKNKTYRNEVAVMHTQLGTMQTTYQQQQQQLNTFAQSMKILKDENYRKINMINVPGKPQALAQVFWNKRTHDVFVADISLPAHAPDKQYQLWAIVNGKPVDGGMLNDTKDAMQKMKDFANADAFAITLEKKGGSPAPTMEQMYVIAKLS